MQQGPYWSPDTFRYFGWLWANIDSEESPKVWWRVGVVRGEVLITGEGDEPPGGEASTLRRPERSSEIRLL